MKLQILALIALQLAAVFAVEEHEETIVRKRSRDAFVVGAEEKHVRANRRVRGQTVLEDAERALFGGSSLSHSLPPSKMGKGKGKGKGM